MQRSAPQSEKLPLPEPHFVYNSLNLLQAFIQEGDKSGALSHLSRFSRMLRLWLSLAAKSSVPLSADVALLDAYLALERDRFAGRFDYTVVLDVPSADTVIVKPLAWYQDVADALYNEVLLSRGRGVLHITFTMEADAAMCIIQTVDGSSNRLPALTQPPKRLKLSP